MTESRPEIGPQLSRITTIDGLVVGKLYRLNRFGLGEDKKIVKIKTEEFYLDKSIDPHSHEFLFQGLVHVRLPAQRPGLGDLYFAYRLDDLGSHLYESAEAKIATIRNSWLNATERSSGVYSSYPRSFSISNSNFVEELGRYL